MQALLDTNICIYIARNRPPAVAERFARAMPGSLGISLITWGELCFGADKSNDPIRAHERLARFVADVPVCVPAPDAGLHYGEIRATLERAGTPIGNNDLWIAAHARALGVALISTNVSEFERVPGLKLENWV
ncbi:MAG: type II toxin-antitoxin system VapC family toxin [Pseudomonadota bacterium]